MEYKVELTMIYNGSVVVEAENEQEALEKAQTNINSESLKDIPDYFDLPDGYLSFGEVTADYAYPNED